MGHDRDDGDGDQPFVRGLSQPADELRPGGGAKLARSAGAAVAAILPARIDRPNPATLIGSGKLAEVKAAADAIGADLVLVNAGDLTYGIGRLDEQSQRVASTHLSSITDDLDRGAPVLLIVERVCVGLHP